MEGSLLRRCTATTANGAPCRVTAMEGSEFCFFHDPTIAEKRRAAQSAGGIERMRKMAILAIDTPDASLTAVADVVALLGQTINQVRRGELDVRASNAVGYLSGILLKALEQSGIEKRLAELEMLVSYRQTKSDPIMDQTFTNESNLFARATTED